MVWQRQGQPIDETSLDNINETETSMQSEYVYEKTLSIHSVSSTQDSEITFTCEVHVAATVSGNLQPFVMESNTVSAAVLISVRGTELTV